MIYLFIYFLIRHYKYGFYHYSYMAKNGVEVVTCDDNTKWLNETDVQKS